ADRPRVLLPRLVTKFPRLRNRIENPHALPGPHIERLNRPGRIAFVLQAIGDAAPDNHQILVNDRGRGLSHLYLGVVVSQAFPQHRVAVLTKTGHQLTGSSIDREETVVAIHEDARLVALAPEGDPAMLVIEVDPRTVQVGLRVESP